MIPRQLAFVYSPELEHLPYPPDCPFKTERITRTRQRLLSFGLLGGHGLQEFTGHPATRPELEQFHSPGYLDLLQQAASGDLTVAGLHAGLGQPDTPVFRHLFDYGALACGHSLTAANLLLQGHADVAFALAGGFHHAMPAKASGFCYLNDAVLACRRLAEANKKVLWLDIDAHHGDGVQAAFYSRADVLTISFHESGKTLYPWSGFEQEIGEGPGHGFNVNVPLPAGTYDAAYLDAFRCIVPPLLQAYGPDVIVLELGMDTLSGDPLTHLALTNNAHHDIIEELLPFQRPTLVLGGGGYHVDNTVRGWALAWRVFSGDAHHDWGSGMGGVMIGNTEWAGGLRDPHLPVRPEQKRRVDQELLQTVRDVQSLIFPLHGIPLPPP